MSTADRQVIAKVKSLEGEVIAISPDGSKRVLMAGDLIYSDEVIDTSKGKVFLAQDGDVVLQTDIAAILGQEELSPEEKAKIEKILKDLEGDEKDALAKVKAAQDQLAALGTGEQGQDMHEPPAYNFYKGATGDVEGHAQVFISFERPGLTEPTFFRDDTPEIFIPPVEVINPIELRATTLNQLANPTDANTVGDYFGILGQHNNIVSQDLSAAFDTLMHSHPDAVFAVTVTGNIADYMASPLEFPVPIILPYGLGVQPWKVVTGDAPNTISYLYRKEDLNLLPAQDSKQDLIDAADKHIQSIADVKNVVEQQISGISNLSLDQFEIKANLNASFAVYDNLKNQLQLDINQLNAQKTVADANLATWESTVHNFGIPLGNITNAAAITSLEASWKILGGTPETMPSVLEGLYAEKAVFEQSINHLDTQIIADQHLLDGIIQDVITPLLLLSNFIPSSDADYKQALMQASLELDKQDTLAQGYKNALINALDNFDLVLRTGLANDSDFAFKSQVLLVDSISGPNSVVVGDIFEQNGGLVNVDALASGLKVELNGDLSHDQSISISSQFDAITTKLILNLDIKFANPSADENIHIEIPGVPGLNWVLSNPPPANGWVLHADNSLTLDLPSTSPLYSSRTGLTDTLTLSFPTSLLKNVELNNFTYKILINSEVIPVGDNEINLNNNVLNQSFNFDINGKLPGRGIYFVESESQADALANVEKHAAVDIKPLLDNISVYLDILSGAAETNFLNNTKIEFRFFNVDPLEPPKVLFNDGVTHSYDFVKSGDSWILTGQALKDYIDAWEAAKLANNSAEILKLEQPYIIAAPYGAEDMLVKVSGLINGANEVVVQDLVPLVVDAVAQEITADDVDLSNVVFNIDFTKFNLKVNIAAPDGDGSESRLVDINLTNVFNYTSDVPVGFNPNWTVFSNNGVWTIDTVSVPGEVHLKGNIQGMVGNSISSELTLGFSTATLEYLPKNGSGNYEIVIGGPAFDVPGTNSAGVISKEILDSQQKDFNLTDDQAGPVYLAAGTTVEVPASIVIRREAQVDVPNLNPSQDSYSINIAKALVDLYATISLDPAAKAIVDTGGNYVIGTNPTVDALVQNTKILLLENGSENTNFTLNGNNLFNKLHDYVTAAPADQAAIGKILYYVGQYEAEVNTVEVKLTDASNTPIIYPDLAGGIILPEKTVVFDAVGSGTEIPDLALIGVVLGFPTSTLNLNFDVNAKDITTEKVEITIELPNAPDASMLKEFAPPGIVFGWQLDPASAPEWTLTNNTLKGVFDLPTLLSTNIISSLALKFNTSVLINLDQNAADSNIFKLGYAIHSIDSDSPANYILSDNQSSDLTGTFNLDVGNLAGIYLIKELDNTDFDAADAILPANNQALLVNINDVMVQMFNKITDAGYDTSTELAQFFASSNITVAITQATLPITEDNLPRVGLNDPTEIILPANATGEDRLIDTNNASMGTTIISGTLLTEIYNAWVASNTDVALRTVPEIAIFGGPFYDNDFKLKVSSTIADILNSADNQSLEVFPETTIVVDATAWGVESINNVPQFFVTPDLDWVIDSTTGLLTGYVDVTYTFDAKFLDLTGLEFHQAILDLSSMPGVDQATMQIVAQTGTDVSWSKPVAGTGIFTSDAMFSSTLNPDMVGSVTIRFNGATLPADFFDNYGLKSVGLNAIFKIVSTIVPVDQEFITADNQTTSTYNSPLVAISNGVDEQGALVNLPQVPVIPPRTVTLDTTVDFTAVFESLKSLYVINNIVTNSANIKASSVVVEVSGIPTTQEIPDVYFNSIIQDVFNPDSVQNGLGKLFSQGGLSSGIVYTLTSDELLQVFTAWLNGGDAHVIVKSGLYNSYPFSVSADGTVIQPNFVPLDVVGQVDTLVRVDASAEGFVNNTMSIDTNVSFEENEDTGVLTGSAIVEVTLKGQLTDVDGSETYRIEIQLPNATGNQFSLYTGGVANELQWVSLGGGKFAADINLTATSGQPGYVPPGFFDNFSTTGQFDTSVKLLISNSDLSGLSGGQIQIVSVLSSHDNQSVATGSTLTSGVIEIVSDNNDYKVVMPQVNESTQVSANDVNELVWVKDIGKLAYQDADFTQLVPIPILQAIFEQLKTAIDTQEFFLDSDELNTRIFNLTIKINDNDPAWNTLDSKIYFTQYDNGEISNIKSFNLDMQIVSPTETQYHATIDGSTVRELYDAYMNSLTYSEDDIPYLTNAFILMHKDMNISDIATIEFKHTTDVSTEVPTLTSIIDASSDIPVSALENLSVDKQTISISAEDALSYLFSQVVDGNGALDAARLSASSIVVSLKGVDAANSLVYLIDPNGSVPVSEASQIGPSPILNNAFIAGSGDVNSWTITGTDLVQIFQERYGNNMLSALDDGELPNIGIMGQIFSGNDISVKLDVILNNPSQPSTTENILPETLYVVDDAAHGAILTSIYDNGLGFSTNVIYQADSSSQGTTTGNLTGRFQIEVDMEAKLLDVGTGEQKYLVFELFRNSTTASANQSVDTVQDAAKELPALTISNFEFGWSWQAVFVPGHGTVFIAKVPDSESDQLLQTKLTFDLSVADLIEKGYVIDKDETNLDPYYITLNDLGVQFDSKLKLVSTLDANLIIKAYDDVNNALDKDYVTNSTDNIPSTDGLTSNNTVINETETQSVKVFYTSTPVTTQDDLTGVDTSNTFSFSIKSIMDKIHERVLLAGAIVNEDVVKSLSITIEIVGANAVIPTLINNEDVPFGTPAPLVSLMPPSNGLYVLSDDAMLEFYYLWRDNVALRPQLEQWFIVSEPTNDKDFSVNVTYNINDYTFPNTVITINGESGSIVEDHLVIVRAVADSTIESQLFAATSPIVHTGEVPALPPTFTAPADDAFDFNAAEAARFITQLHVQIDFAEPNPDVTRFVEIFIPTKGSNPDNVTGNIDLSWKLVPGADNGWQIDYTNDPMHPNQIRLFKQFSPGSTTGNIDDYLDLSFLMTGVGGYDLRNIGQAAILQYIGVSYQVTTVSGNFDFGGGDILEDESALTTVSQAIVVPSFIKASIAAPAVFSTQNDYYYVSDPDSGLTINRTIVGIGPVVSGTTNDPDANYDIFYPTYVLVENGSAEFNVLYAILSLAGDPANPFPFPSSSGVLFDQHIGSEDFLLPGDAVTDANYNYIKFGWDNSLDPIHTFHYEYQLKAGASSVVSEYSVGRFFEPGEGDDIVIGSYGRDTFKSSQNDFVGGTNTPLLDVGGQPVDLGNDVFVGGLGRDWIEGGAGNDIAYSDGMPTSSDIYSINYVDFAPVFLSSSIGSASIYLPKITDVIATGAGDDIIYTGGSNYASLFGTGGPSISGHDAAGIIGKDAGVLVFAGPGDNVIFSGKGADIIVLDDTIGITRVVPTSSGFVVPTEYNLDNGLHYVYNSNVTGGNFAGLFTGSGDTATFNSAQTLNTNGSLSVISDYNGSGAGVQNSYLYDIIRPIYNAITDTDLTYSDASSGATDIIFRTAEHGANTLVYWKDSVSADANSADVVMYFDITSDKINLTALFSELNPTLTETQRLDAISFTSITSVTPFDSTSSGFGTASYDPFSTDGRDGTRVSVTVTNAQNVQTTYVIADLANVKIADATLAKQDMFEVMQAPDAHFS